MLRQKKYNSELIHIADMVLIADYMLGGAFEYTTKEEHKKLIKMRV